MGKTLQQALCLLDHRFQRCGVCRLVVFIILTVPIGASSTSKRCLHALVPMEATSPLFGSTLPGDFDPVGIRARMLFGTTAVELGAWNERHEILQLATEASLKKRFKKTIFKKEVVQTSLQVLKYYVNKPAPTIDKKLNLRVVHGVPYKATDHRYKEHTGGYDPIFSAQPISNVRSRIAAEFKHIHLGKEKGSSLGDLIEKGSLSVAVGKNQVEHLKIPPGGLQLVREKLTGIQFYHLEVEIEASRGSIQKIELVLPPSLKETPMSVLYFSIFTPRSDILKTNSEEKKQQSTMHLLRSSVLKKIAPGRLRHEREERAQSTMHLLQSPVLRELAPGWYWREREESENISQFLRSSVFHHSKMALLGNVFSEISKKPSREPVGRNGEHLYAREITLETGSGKELGIKFVVDQKVLKFDDSDMTVLQLSDENSLQSQESEKPLSGLQQDLNDDERSQLIEQFKSLSIHHENFWNLEKDEIQNNIGFMISPNQIQYLPFRFSANKVAEIRVQSDLPDLEIVVIKTLKGPSVFMRSFLKDLNPKGEFKPLQNFEMRENSLSLVSLHGAPIILRLTKDDGGGTSPQFDLSPDLDQWVEALNYSKAPTIDLTRLNLAIEDSAKLRNVVTRSFYSDFYNQVMPEIQKQTARASKNELNVAVYTDILRLFEKNLDDDNFNRASSSLLRRAELEISAMVEKLKVSHTVYVTALKEMIQWRKWLDKEKKQVFLAREIRKKEIAQASAKSEKAQMTPIDVEYLQNISDLEKIEVEVELQIEILNRLIHGNSFLRKKLNIIIAPIKFNSEANKE